MKKLVLIACAIAGFVGSSFAGFGNNEYWYDGHGGSYWGYWSGTTYYWSGNDQYGNYHCGTGYISGGTLYLQQSQ